MERKMFYGAAPDLLYKAKQLRENMTPAEKKMWEYLKENKFNVRFKAQRPIDIFIADFYCHELKLIIEIDGEIHNNQREKDEARSSELQNYGIKIFRFTNDDVINDIKNVLLQIKESIAGMQLFKNVQE